MSRQHDVKNEAGAYHLIAAAPDMLAALQNMVAYCTPYAKDFDFAAVIEQARAAIAKAEGKGK
jgi:hypothetical protein